MGKVRQWAEDRAERYANLLINAGYDPDDADRIAWETVTGGAIEKYDEPPTKDAKPHRPNSGNQ
jgi:S-adenosylmethionine synthetase